MDELKEYLTSSGCSDKDRDDLTVFAGNVIDFMNVLSPSENETDLVIKRYHNRVLDELSRKCLYFFKNYLKNSVFKENSGSIYYLFKAEVDKSVITLRYKY